MALTWLDLNDIDPSVPAACRFRTRSSHLRNITDVPRAYLPPVVVFQEVEADGRSHFWLSDGGYRFAASRQRKNYAISADVRPGTCADAVLYHCQANHRHGVPRTNADKRDAVLRLLGNPLWSGQSDVWISEQCQVSDRYVAKLRGKLGQNPTERIGRDGKTRRIPSRPQAEFFDGDDAEPRPLSSRDQALAEIALAKAEIDAAQAAVEEAGELERLPTDEILARLEAAREEILIWERTLEEAPAEPPVPDPDDRSPEGLMAAEMYRIRRMGPDELFGMMEKMMSHDTEWLGEGREQPRLAGASPEHPMLEGPEDVARYLALQRGEGAPPREVLRSDNPVRTLPLGMRSLDPRQMEADFNAKFAWLYREIRTPPAAEADVQPRTKRAVERGPAEREALPLLPYLPDQPRTKRAGDPPEGERFAG